MSEVTRILASWEQGDPAATERLLPLVYDELRQLAMRQLAREKPGQTLQATALVHEAYLRLIGTSGEQPSWENRGHFFAAAAQAMRRILIENARRKNRQKRGGGKSPVALDWERFEQNPEEKELLLLHEALAAFAEIDPQKAQLVELRFFAGLTLKEAAACLNISPSTADRAWRYSRAWLYAAMAEDSSPETSENPSPP